MGFAAAASRFASIARRTRVESYPASVTTIGQALPLAVTKSPTKITRDPAEQGIGWIQTARCSFSFPVTGAFSPRLGADFTLVTCDQPDEVGTRWRCNALTLGNAATGADHVAGCFRLD